MDALEKKKADVLGWIALGAVIFLSVILFSSHQSASDFADKAGYVTIRESRVVCEWVGNDHRRMVCPAHRETRVLLEDLGDRTLCHDLIFPGRWNFHCLSLYLR